MAKQTTIIPVVIAETYQSLIAGLEKVSLDIPTRRRRYNQATAGKTVVSITLYDDIEYQSYIMGLKNVLGGIMAQGVVVVVTVGNYADEDGLEPTSYPAALASDDFPLITVGVVDQEGIKPDWAGLADVYYCGVGVLCAKKETGGYMFDASGSCGSVGSFVGLVAYLMGKETPPFAFGDSEVSQYPSIVRDYFTQGAGAYVRPGGSVRVAWNGLDGRTSTNCPLHLKKRQDGEGDDCQLSSASSSIAPTQATSSTSSSITPTQTANPFSEVNVNIYYSKVEPCDVDSGVCDLTYYAYAPQEPEGLPIQECGGALGQGSDSVQFQLYTLTGASDDFTYTPSSGSGGTITGSSLASPIQCTDSTSQARAWECPATKKRTFWPDTVIYTYVFYEVAACNWNLG